MTFNCPELVEVSQRGDLATVKQLVESGADVNSTNKHGAGPLLTFSPAVIEYLLASGADANRQRNENGAPVLVGIAYMQDVECVRLLLEGGADPNLVTERTGESALHSCLAKPAKNGGIYDQHTIVRLLIDRGANPNHRTIPGATSFNFWRDVRTRGETPLHRAAAYGSDQTIKFLLDAGADKTIRDANGDSPQSWASWHWRPKPIIDLLLQAPK
jgi:cytohesin